MPCDSFNRNAIVITRLRHEAMLSEKLLLIKISKMTFFSLLKQKQNEHQEKDKAIKFRDAKALSQMAVIVKQHLKR